MMNSKLSINKSTSKINTDQNWDKQQSEQSPLQIRLNSRRLHVLRRIPKLHNVAKLVTQRDCIWSISGQYFPAFGLNAERYYSFRMRENKDQKNSKYGHFYAVLVSKSSLSILRFFLFSCRSVTIART